jgi:hypothetical protein
MTVTNKNYVHEEIKKRLNSGIACYHAIQVILSSCQLSKEVKVKVYENIILCNVTFFWVVMVYNLVQVW